MPAAKVNVIFPDPLQDLWSELPETDDKTYFSTKVKAGVVLLKEVQAKLLDRRRIRDP